MECYCYLRDVQESERIFGESFKGPTIPFDALVGYLQKSERDKARIHQCGKKVLPRSFSGYALIAGEIWEEDTLIADIEELGKLDASEMYPRSLKKRLRIPRTHSETGIDRKERESQRRVS